MVRTKYKLKPKDYKVVKRSITQPDQALSIKEIVRRFVRNIPVDINVAQPVYIDQQKHDLSKLANLDLAEKAFEAIRMSEETEHLAQKVESDQRAMQEQAERKKHEAQKSEDSSTGIDNLDNTMPVDTNADTQRVKRGVKK